MRMRERSVVADQLPDAAGPEDPDQDGRAEHRHGERDPAGDQEGDHRECSVTRSSATRSSPTARLAFTSTASPGCSSSRQDCGRGSGVDAPRGCSGTVPRAPSATPGASTTITTSMPDVPASAPIARVLVRRVVAQLQHLAQHRDPTPGDGKPRERLHGRGRRRRARVVGVVDHDEPVGRAQQLHAEPRRGRAGDAGCDRLERAHRAPARRSRPWPRSGPGARPAVGR